MITYLSLHCQCHHQPDFCIKMGSEESHFNVSVGSDGQSHRTLSTNHSLFEEKGAEAVSNRGPSAYQPNALPLGQTGSLKKLPPNLSLKKVCCASHICLNHIVPHLPKGPIRAAALLREGTELECFASLLPLMCGEG